MQVEIWSQFPEEIAQTSRMTDSRGQILGMWNVATIIFFIVNIVVLSD